MDSIQFIAQIFLTLLITSPALATCNSWMHRQEFLCSNHRYYMAGIAQCKNEGSDEQFDKSTQPNQTLIFCEKSHSKSLKTCLANEGKDNIRCMEEFKDVFNSKKQNIILNSCRISLRILRDVVLKKYIRSCHEGNFEELTNLAHLASFQLNKNQEVTRLCSTEVRKRLGRKILQATLTGRDAFKRDESSYTPGNGHQRCAKISRFLFNLIAIEN